MVIKLQPLHTALGLGVAALLAASAVAQGPASPDSGAMFGSTVGPLISRRCISCHNARESSGGLDLSSEAAARKGGKHGVAWIAGDPNNSFLLQRVSSRQ